MSLMICGGKGRGHSRTSRAQLGRHDKFDDSLADSLATTAGMLYPVVVLGADGAFTVYDETQVTLLHGDAESTIHIQPGTEFVQGMVVEIRGLTDSPSTVTDNDQPVFVDARPSSKLPGPGEALWDATKKRLTIRVESGDRIVTLSHTPSR